MSNAALTVSPPWASADSRPAGIPDELLRRLVQHAILAPSGHNTQPWRFRVREGALELVADRTRALPVVDRHDRELIMSCGAALFFLRVALRHFSHAGAVDVLPDPADATLLARVRLGEAHLATEDDDRLFCAIEDRRTNRRAFDGRPVPNELLRDLVECAAMEGAWLRVVTEPALKATVAELVAEGDRRQAADPAFRRELAAWMRPNMVRSRDGMPGHAFGFGDVTSVFMPFVMRMFNWGTRQAAMDAKLVVESPALLLLGTDADSTHDWLRAGQALGRLLLRATADGVSASFLNQPIEVAPLRARLAVALGVPGFPQLLLRAGYGPEVQPSPRRDVSDVLIDDR